MFWLGKTAKSERERQIFTQMRDAWLDAARRWEIKEARSNPVNQAENHRSQLPRA